jgi:hypothetical protein
MLHKLAVSMSQEEDGRNEKFLKENLAMMAVKVGEMQAQMMRLDALGERVQGLAGIRPEEFNFKESPGRGGAEVSSLAGPAAMSAWTSCAACWTTWPWMPAIAPITSTPSNPP